MKGYYLFYRDQLYIWTIVASILFLMGNLIGRGVLFVLFFCVILSPFLLSGVHQSFISYLKSMFTSVGLVRMLILSLSVLFIVESVFLFVCIDYFFDGNTNFKDIVKSFFWVGVWAISLTFIYRKKLMLKVNDEGIIIAVLTLILGFILQSIGLGYIYSSASYFGSPMSVILDCFCIGNFIYILNSSLRFKQ
ncbi:hypothetical protein SAMN05660337_0915 [Maridesulfovibrio ferrireducens]|uniref:Uncharacterized protein n=1 Tax=Maridesulfovibrio ferrireducens TaxID=246191 RepID=A0A1G9D5S8_9BACT|nr:hypothetical protein [Maridesulfovibrio ferrireducens]SDK59074.1 hypothetical protein SAMN05660337_0915 [Maridesulfovibrio ferrireducens]